MDEVTRRQAMKLAATTGAVAAGAGALGTDAAQAQDEAKKKAKYEVGGEVELGSKESYKLTQGDQAFAAARDEATAFASNNCEEKKNEIRARFQVVEFGSCSHPVAALADAQAVLLAAEVLARGGVRNLEAGHRTVRNRRGIFRYNTYLAYAGGDRL